MSLIYKLHYLTQSKIRVQLRDHVYNRITRVPITISDRPMQQVLFVITLLVYGQAVSLPEIRSSRKCDGRAFRNLSVDAAND